MSFGSFSFLVYKGIFLSFLLLLSQVTVVTSRPGQGTVRHLEMGLKDADLISLKRLLVIQICSAGDWGQDTPSEETTYTENEGRRYIHTVHGDRKIYT